MPAMEGFPLELLTHIFGFLHPVYDRLPRLSAVCHEWKAIIQTTPSLWEHIHLKSRHLSGREKNIVFKCLRVYEVYIKCLRVASLDVVFGYDFWFFIRHVTLKMTNLTCLDIPTFPWNLGQFTTFRSAESLKELNLYGFWDLSDIKWTQNYTQPVSLINQGHLKLVRARCRKLEVLKLSVNMLRLTDIALMDFLNNLSNLKDLQISAYNSNEANIPMNRYTIKLVKCLLSSNYISIITKLDLRFISIGHKELRLLLKLLRSLRDLKLCFLDTHRCVTGYQYLESKTLQYCELDGLPATNIVRLKCSMPKLRRLIVNRCSNLKSLQVVSFMLEHLSLNFLANLRSLHVTSTTLKRFEVANCESLTPKTIDKLLQINRRIEHCTIRGRLVDFHVSQVESSRALTELCLWMTDFSKVQSIQVHCPTLRSFMCNYHAPEGEFSGSIHQECCVDIRCNVLLDAYISLPQVKSIEIKCASIVHLLLNAGKKKLDMLCYVMRVSADTRIRTVRAKQCNFTRAEFTAEKIDNLDFDQCRINGEIKLAGNYVDIICIRNMARSQENINIVMQCNKIKKVILSECDKLCSITVLPEKQLVCSKTGLKKTQQITQDPSSTAYEERTFDCDTERHQGWLNSTFSRTAVDGPIKLVNTVATFNCPCFRGLLLNQTKENKIREDSGSEFNDSSSEKHPSR